MRHLALMMTMVAAMSFGLVGCGNEEKKPEGGTSATPTPTDGGTKAVDKDKEGDAFRDGTTN